MKNVDIYDAGEVQKELLDSIEKKSSPVIDPTNSYALMLESIGNVASAAMEEANTLVRKVYPDLCQNTTDLMRHATGVETIGLMASPTNANLTFYMNGIDILTNGVDDDVIQDSKKVILNAGTTVTVDNVTFTISNDIIVRYDGNLAIVEQTNDNTLTGSGIGAINAYIVKIGSSDWIQFDLNITQFKINTHHFKRIANFKETITLEDSLWYIKAYGLYGTNEVEMEVTYSDIVYNVNVPTIRATITDQELTLEIPNIYVLNDKAPLNIRIDVYETKGRLSMILAEFKQDEYIVNTKLNDIGQNTTTIIVLSNSVVSGGKDTKTIDEVRKTIINNTTGPLNNIITESQLKELAFRDGYEITLYKDILSKRLYTYSKNVDPNVFKDIKSDPNIFLANISFDTSTKGSSIVVRNDSIVIPKETLFELSNGIQTVVTDQFLIDSFNGNSTTGYGIDVLRNKLTEKRHLFSLYTNIVYPDNTCEIYELHDPIIDNRRIINRNVGSKLIINTESHTVENANDTYVIALKLTTSNVNYSLNPIKAKLRLTQTNGTSIMFDSRFEYIEEIGYIIFELRTNSYVSQDKRIAILDVTGNEKLFPLRTEAELLIYTDPTGFVTDYYPSIDFNLGSEYLGLTYEKLNIEFGTHKDNFFNDMGVEYTARKYKKYTEDVPYFYTEDVYNFELAGGTCDAEPYIVHNKGDIKYIPLSTKDISLGVVPKPSLRYKKGDNVIVNGNPVIDETFGRLLKLNLICLELPYLIHNGNFNKNAVLLVKEFLKTFHRFGDVLSENKLESTTFKYIPMKSTNLVKVNINNTIKYIEQEIKPVVRIYIKDGTTFDYDLAVIGRNLEYALEERTITYDNIREKLKDKLGVIAVTISDLGVGFDSEVLDVLSSQFIIAKKINLNNETVYDIDVRIIKI